MTPALDANEATTDSPSIDEALQAAIRTLRASSASASLDAQVLLAAVMNCDRSGLLVRSQTRLARAHALHFDQLIARRAAGVPVAYLTGVKEFWSLPLRITPDVLVPRPETEVLVERVLEHIGANDAVSVLDLGTGSGAIALAIACERPSARVTGVDISTEALAVARANAQSLGLDSVRWQRGDWLDAVPGERFDVIVANPPYIAAADPHLRSLEAEPTEALVAGHTGMEAYQRIVPAAREHLAHNGLLALEHGAGQAQALTNLLERHGFHAVRSHPDLSNVPRVVLGLNSRPR